MSGVSDVEEMSVLAKQLVYDQEAFVSGKLQYVPFFPNQYGSPIVLTTGQVPTVINLPTDVYNLSQSILMYTVTLDESSTENSYVWTPEDTFAEISHIQFYGSSGQLIVDLDNANNYFKIVGKHETSFSEFKTNDIVNRLYSSDSLNNVVPALRVLSGAGGETIPASINYDEPAYFQVSAVDSSLTYQVQLPLRYFKNTLFSVDKNLYFNQIMYIKIFWGPYTKMAFQSLSNTSPTGGTPTTYTPNNPSNCQIRNLQLMLACETKPNEKLRIIEQVQKYGLNMIIPFAYNYKNSVAQGTSQNVNLQLDIGSGRTLMRIYHAVFNSNEQGNTMFDCSNLSTGDSTSEKVNNYWTNLNGQRNQTITIDTTTNGFNTDYMNLKNSLKGSVLQDMSVFKYNWHHLDDFSNFENHYLFDNGSELVAGFPLGPTPITWTFVGNSMINAAYNHYSWGIFTKVLKISATGPVVE